MREFIEVDLLRAEIIIKLVKDKVEEKFVVFSVWGVLKIKKRLEFFLGRRIILRGLKFIKFFFGPKIIR